MEIRQEKETDIQGIYELNCNAFETSEEAKIVNALRKSGQIILSLVAIENEQIIGHVAFSPMAFGEDRSNYNVVALAPMAVDPERQKSGIGTQLINTAKKILKEKGVVGILLIGHPDYYPRFGFKPVHSAFGFESEFDVPDNVFLGFELVEGKLGRINKKAYFRKEFSAGL